ncbi:MAG: preprotein translocase subunit Sec61beta [Candidatus Micrarchaeia archaeon]|jgi:preprotein translocase subunit Sec61beta
MSDNRISTPSSAAGIVRFYDINSSNVQIDPRLVVAFAAGVIIIEIAARALH